LVLPHSKQNIVRNGKQYRSNYFDRDINGNAILLPKHTNKVSLEIYVNPNDIQQGTDSTVVRSFGYALPNSENPKKFQLTTFVSRVRVDSDLNVVAVKLEGDAAHSGVIVSDVNKAKLDLTFDCTELGGDSTIEVDILLPVFKDVSFYFVKQCPAAMSSGWKYFFIFIMLVAFFGFLQQNVKQKSTNWTNIFLTLFGKLETFYEKVLNSAKTSQFNRLATRDDFELKGIDDKNENDEEAALSSSESHHQDFPVSRPAKFNNNYGTI